MVSDCPLALILLALFCLCSPSCDYQYMRSRLLGLTVATVIRFGEGGCRSTKVTISGLREEKRGREEGRVHEKASSEVSSRRREEREE